MLISQTRSAAGEESGHDAERSINPRKQKPITCVEAGMAGPDDTGFYNEWDAARTLSA